MKMTKEEFISLLIEKANEYDILISNNQTEKLYMYKELLLEWNDKINLTSIVEDKEIIVKHFVDSLLCVKHIEENTNMIDVGTGAGFPGIVLAVYFEGKINITLLDSLQKRINFLNIVIEKLELKNIKAVHGRAEEFAHKSEYRERFNIAVARAVAPLNVLLEYLSGYVIKGGKCICMKSLSSEQEIDSASKAIDMMKMKLEESSTAVLKLNGEEILRKNIIFVKTDNLHGKYPRNYGKIKKNPL